MIHQYQIHPASTQESAGHDLPLKATSSNTCDLTAFYEDLSPYHKLNVYLMKHFSVEAKLTQRNNAAFKVDSFDMSR